MAMSIETPNTVHGRLLEAVHISGYTFERACAELEWLLDEDRWKSVGGGYADINAFLGTIDFSEFRIAVEQRKKLAKRLQAIEASQRATARVLGVAEGTVRGDLREPPPAQSYAPRDSDARNRAGIESPAAVPAQSYAPPDPADTPVADPGWFQADADPSGDAKRVTRNTARDQQRDETRVARTQVARVAGRYQLIYADPPWQYEHVETENRAVENHYPTMSLDAICVLQVPAADAAVLFLWATSPKLAESLRVVEAWGFSYRTCAVWDKEIIGMGYYFRQQHELLLVGTRGSLPVPDPSARPSSVLRAKRRQHSQKPEIVYEVLEQMYPAFTADDRLEMFARAARPGWTAWGNDPAVAS